MVAANTKATIHLVKKGFHRYQYQQYQRNNLNGARNSNASGTVIKDIDQNF